MFSGKFNTSRLCLICTLASALWLQGCREKEPASAADTADSSKAAIKDKANEPTLKRAEYASDLERLDQLTERVNRACRGSFVVVLGAGDSAANGRLIGIDYALFDRLSDDGAAVLIAEAIAAKPKSPSPSQIQVHGNTENNILQTDESVGRYIERAGFSSAGFAEWLKARKLSAAGPQQDSVPEKMRVTAFMRGYASESSVRKAK